MADDVQALCEIGQQQLNETRYWEAELTLEQAEAQAYAARDWDTLARVYMPLQETRRQRRQLGGEGVVDLTSHLADTPGVVLQAQKIATAVPHGQILVAGYGTIGPAVELRQIARARRLYLDVLLGATYGVAGGGLAVVVVPRADVALPPAGEYAVDELIRRAPPHALVLAALELPRPWRRGDTASFAYTMDLFERLHRPFLAMADAAQDGEQQIALYRQTIEVDYAAEFAHQRLSAVARQLARQQRRGG